MNTHTHKYIYPLYTYFYIETLLYWNYLVVWYRADHMTEPKLHIKKLCKTSDLKKRETPHHCDVNVQNVILSAYLFLSISVKLCYTEITHSGSFTHSWPQDWTQVPCQTILLVVMWTSLHLLHTLFFTSNCIHPLLYLILVFSAV